MKRFLTWAVGMMLMMGFLYLLSAPAVAVEKGPRVPPTRSTTTEKSSSQTLDFSGLAASVHVAPPSAARSIEISTLTMSWSAIGNTGMLGDVPPYVFGGLGGQTAVGSGEGPGIRFGSGFWYGARACYCGFQSDGNSDGVVDAEDLNGMIDALFFGGANPKDFTCPNARFDFDCNNYVDANDLNALIDYLFFGGAAPCGPCP